MYHASMGFEVFERPRVSRRAQAKMAPSEKAVEAAAKALWLPYPEARTWGKEKESEKALLREAARRALTAALPYLYHPDDGHTA